MGYLGQQSTFTGTQNSTRSSVVAESNQSSFLVPGGYDVNSIDVYRNGSKLVSQRNYTAIDGVTVNLVTPASGGDIIEFVTFENFVVADVLNGNGDQVVNGNFLVTGNLGIGGTLSATSTSSIVAGIATEAIRAGMSTEATKAGIATEAIRAGIATNAVRAGMSTEAAKAGIATEAIRAGIATNAVRAGMATEAASAGISTASRSLSIGATGTDLNLTGIITASGGFNIGIQSAGINVTTGVITALNFVGSGNTFLYNAGTKTVNISIAGGGGGGATLDITASLFI